MPSFITFAGGLIQMGISKVNVAISIGVSVPIGILRELQFVEVKKTAVKLVQST